jgi:hypothetical protein
LKPTANSGPAQPKNNRLQYEAYFNFKENKVYDMYPYPEAITQRASEAELRKREHQGIEIEEPRDLVDAHLVSTAERAVAEANNIGFQIGRRVMDQVQEQS